VDPSGLDVERWARDEDLRGTKYEKKSPEEIERAVQEAFLYDPRVSSFKVTPEVAGNGVTLILRGTVDNLKAKRAAAQDARNTVGVREVDNLIKVRPTERLSDEKIQDKIRQALLRDPIMEKYDINVKVRSGVAVIYGNVDSFFERSLAENVISKVKGVVMVDNNLMVREDYIPYFWDPYLDDWVVYDREQYPYDPSYPYKDDWKIKADIENELFWSPFVDADDVNVRVDDGEVTLTGTVDSWSEYEAATNNAYEGGAIDVDNELVVE
jgi:osmotically-inducible protein OsmY